jgi:hypothetical protein
MTRKAIGFVTDSAPDGGYQLSQVIMAPDGALRLEVLAYRSHLWELQDIEHRMKSRTFGEAAWVPPELVRPKIYQPHQQHQEPPPPPPLTEHMIMPRVVEKDPRQQEQDLQRQETQGLINRLRSNGYTESLMPVVVISTAVALWMHARLGGLV